MKFNESVFHAYDIRGRILEDITPELAHAVGQALADFLPIGIVAVGRDMRLGSAELSEALIEGLVKQGRDVWDLGRITTDMSYWAVGQYQLAGAAMVTASHNPAQYNGFKLTGSGVTPIGSNSGLNTIKQSVMANKYKASTKLGKATQKHVLRDWVEHCITLSGDEFAPLKVGVDTGNGMEAIVLPYLHELTALQIHGLDLALDGSFPHHVANPMIASTTADLQEMVTNKKLDCGLAFDGDGDRVFMIDEHGKRVSAGELGTLLAAHMIKTNPSATILYSAPTSHLVRDTIEQLGGKADRTQVGHSFILEQMKTTKAVFGCEHSGHFYFGNNYGADSGLIAALTMLHILSTSDKTLSQLVKGLDSPYYSIDELNLTVKDTKAVISKIKETLSDGVQDNLDGLTIEYPDWWCNVRASNTEPVLRVNVEANTKQLLADKTKHLSAMIKT